MSISTPAVRSLIILDGAAVVEAGGDCQPFFAAGGVHLSFTSLPEARICLESPAEDFCLVTHTTAVVFTGSDVDNAYMR